MTLTSQSDIRLTQYSHGAGCGCKISPALLDKILSETVQNSFPNLLVGYEHKDDAAVYDWGDGTAVISTTDFFMPIVDDPFLFGQIASVNAISDVYAMGGTPVMAIGILGWPINKLSHDVAAKVLEGARNICKQANIPLAGGHSIDAPEPIFGLAVTGRVNISDLKTNGGAKAGDLLFLTKPIGVGILTTAEKKGILQKLHQTDAIRSMLALNNVGMHLSKHEYVHAITDVTGFGLGGHCLEMCRASHLDAEINYVKIPLLNAALPDYIQKGAVPGGTKRNWESYGNQIILKDDSYIPIIADPQTSGGLLIAVDPNHADSCTEILRENNCMYQAIGELSAMKKEQCYITIR